MKLQIIKRKTGKTHGNPTDRLLNVNRKSGYFSLNSKCSEDFALSNETRILIAKDEESRNDWYVAFGTESLPDSITLREKGKVTLSYRGMHKTAAYAILNSVKADKSATFLIAEKPMEVDGIKWYRIMTATPIRKI